MNNVTYWMDCEYGSTSRELFYVNLHSMLTMMKRAEIKGLRLYLCCVSLKYIHFL